MFKLSTRQIIDLPTWLPVEGFPKYEVNCRDGLVRNVKTLKVLKPCQNNTGYHVVNLHKDSKGHTKDVHRIVANAAFGHYNIPTDGLLVMHLDEERHDQRISNLALGTQVENMNFEKAKQRNSESHKGKCHSEETRKKMSYSRKGEKAYWFGKHLCEDTKKKISDAKPKKAVGSYKNGELILKFESISEAGRQGFDCRAVSDCCLGRRRVHKGYTWKYI